MAYSGLSGQYGTIPFNVFRNKYEKTNFHESPFAVGDYQRQMLTDLSCDQPFFESDQKREDTHSEEILSLRYSGHRSGETPDMPDLFLGFTDRDPRGYTTDPRFNKAAEMTWAKQGSWKFYSDASHTVTEREKMPHTIQRQLRNEMENIKSRLKIFSTSRDGRPSGGPGVTHTGVGGDSRVDQSEGDGATSEEFSPQRTKDATMALSNSLPLGWEQTGDHEFKIASYSLLRSQGKDGDLQTNRYKTDENQYDNLTRFQDQIVPVGMARLMKTIADERALRIQTGDSDITKSVEQTTSQYRTAVDVKPRTDAHDTTQSLKPEYKTVERFIGALRAQTGIRNADVETQLQVLNTMETAVRAPTASAKDARFTAQQIVASTVNGRSNTVQNREAAASRVDGSKREVAPTVEFFRSLAVAPLGKFQMTRTNDQLKHVARGERFEQTSRPGVSTAKGTRPELRDPYTARETQTHETKNVLDRTTRGLGNKYTRDLMDTSRELNSVAASS